MYADTGTEHWMGPHFEDLQVATVEEVKATIDVDHSSCCRGLHSARKLYDAS